MQKKQKGNKVNSDEAKIKKVLEDRGMSVAVAGSGGAGADITAKNEKNLWIIEVKGNDNNWMSSDNQEKKGNVPAKQLFNRLSSIVDFSALLEWQYSGYEPLLLATTGIGDWNFLYIIYDDKERVINYGPIDYVGIKRAMLDDSSKGDRKHYFIELLEEYGSNHRNCMINNKDEFIELIEHLAESLQKLEEQRYKDYHVPELQEDQSITLIPVIDFNEYKNNLKKIDEIFMAE